MRTDSDSRPDRLLPWVGAVVALWAIARIALAFTQTDTQLAFGHDASYLWIVARNVMLGLGFVNDAHWLVFLHPDALPVPYHNAAPLFSFLIATVASTGLGPTTAGYLVNAVAGVCLVPAVAWLLRALDLRWSHGLALGLAAALYRPVSDQSWVYGTNGLTILFAILCLGAVAHRGKRWGAMAGVFFGLAWLSRGDVILILPAIAFYLAARDGIRPSMKAMAGFGAAAAVTASPWLIHSWRVWGSPLRSDSSYYLVQDFLAIRQQGITVWEYWHSPQVPDGLLHVVSSDPIGFALHTLQGIPTVIINTLGDWAFGNLFVAAVLAVLALAGTLSLWRHRRLELAALAILAVSHVGLWAVRHFTYETRYLSILAVFFVVVCGIGLIALLRRAERAGVPRWAAMGVEIGLLLLIVVAPSLLSTTSLLSPNNEILAYREFYQSVDRISGDESPVVVGDKPYYFTQQLQRGSLSIPYSDDGFLLEYMEKFGARYIALTDAELDFWHPEWRDPNALPPFLEPVQGVGDNHLFRRTDGE